jgi:sensor c-di-GMP phosphodiesterase-like protein
VFSGYQVKDISRLSRGRLLCSTLLSVQEHWEDIARPDVIMDDGTLVFALPDGHGTAMYKNDANVVIEAAAYEMLNSDQYQFSVYLTNKAQTAFAALYHSPNAQPRKFPSEKEKPRLPKDMPGLKRCDHDSSVCVTLSRAVGTKLNADSYEKLLWSSLGVFGGAVVYLILTAYRSRDQRLDTRLLRAIKERKLDIVYQTIVNMSDGTLVGFEALLRWEIRSGEFVPPAVFVSIAESKGYSDKLTKYVSVGVIEELGPSLIGRPDIYVTINVAPTELRDVTIVEAYIEIFRGSGLKPSQIIFELTERTEIDFSGVTKGLNRLREEGYRVYIDDFGTGYSTLSHLGGMEIDGIKIDKAFTRTVGSKDDVICIVPQILAMARKLRLGVVVEGIETPQQANYFQKIRPSVLGQGWHIGKPMPSYDAIELIKHG